MSNASLRRWAFVTGLTYVVIGVVAGELAGTATTIQARNAWRLAAWLVSFAVLFAQLVYDHRSAASTSVSTARRVAGAVALGAFGLAVVGPVRAHWGEPGFWRTAVLSLVAWPLITGVPAFLAAFVADGILGRMISKKPKAVSAS